MKKPFLKTDRLDLYTLSSEHISDDYFNWLNDEEVCQENSHHRFPNTDEKMKKYVAQVSESSESLVLAIFLREIQKHVGNISLSRIDLINRSAELTILIGEKSVWGQGIGLEASKILISHAFFQLGLNRISCATPEKNQAMQNLALSLGMKEEGVLRQSFFKNGVFENSLFYGILRHEFKV